MASLVAQKEISYTPRVLEEHAIENNYHKKKRMVTIAIICLAILVGLTVWFIVYNQRDRVVTPEMTLEQLKNSARPVESTAAERIKAGQALKASSSAPTTTREDRMRIMNSFNQ